MPAPIYLPQRQQNPMATMLQQLVMMKMQHNMEMDRAEAMSKITTAAAQAQAIKDRQQKLEDKGFRPNNPDNNTGPPSPNAIRVGDQIYDTPNKPEEIPGYAASFNPSTQSWEQKKLPISETPGTIKANGKVYQKIIKNGKVFLGEEIGSADGDKTKWSTPQKGMDENGKPIVYRVNDKNEVKVLKGVQPTPGKGMKVYDSNQNLILDTTGGGGQITAPTRNDIEKKLVATNEGLARISGIVKGFKPEFQEIPTRLGIEWSSIKAKLGANVPPKDKERLKEFAAYRQDSLGNINLYIKEITGAQMSEKEADRLREAQPDPGKGVFSGDDPVEFKSKLVNQYKKLRSSAIRYNYYLKQGIREDDFKSMIKNGSIISLDKMEEIINQKGKQYEDQIKRTNPGMPVQSVYAQVKARLAQEFGVQ